MPNRLWRHVCRGREIVEGSPRCVSCGARGVFDGWRLSIWEAARVYHLVYGLNPFGPHRLLADRLLAPLRNTCVRCDGRTILTVDEQRWRHCPVCEGTGGVWNRSFAEVDALWHQVVAHWPNAVPSRGSP